MNAKQLAKLSRTLAKGATVGDLVAATGLCRQAVSGALHAMQAERAAFVMGWQHDLLGRPAIAVWRNGGKANVPRPMAKTPAQRQAARRAKLRTTKAK